VRLNYRAAAKLVVAPCRGHGPGRRL